MAPALVTARSDPHAAGHPVADHGAQRAHSRNTPIRPPRRARRTGAAGGAGVVRRGTACSGTGQRAAGTKAAMRSAQSGRPKTMRNQGVNASGSSATSRATSSTGAQRHPSTSSSEGTGSPS
jgi:hypothetical protein